MDVQTFFNSSTEIIMFPSCSKYPNAVFDILSHSSWTSSWYTLIAAAQNSSKSIFLEAAGESIFIQKSIQFSVFYYMLPNFDRKKDMKYAELKVEGQQQNIHMDMARK